MAGFYNSQETGLARAFSKLGHMCDIVLFGGKSDYVETVEHDFEGRAAQTKIFYMRGLALYDAGLFLGLKDLAKGYDIIQVAEYDQIQSWLIARAFPGKTIVYHGPYHCDFNKRYNLKCSAADKLLVPGYKRWKTPFLAKSELAASFLRAKGLKDVETVGVGLDIAQLSSGASANRDAHKLVSVLSREKARGVRRLLYVGRIEPRRNPGLLVELLKSLRTEIDVSLTVIGNGEESYVVEWVAGVRRAGLADSVHYVPGLPNANLREVYRLCEAFLLPTSFEIFGMVLLEAMYYGVVPVSTMNGGSSTVMTHGVTGVIVDSLDVADWVSAVKSLLSDERAFDSMSEAASKKIREGFTWDALAPRFVAQYEKLSSDYSDRGDQ